MKKVFALLLVAGMVAFFSCGGEKKDDKKAKEDSIKVADSLAKVKAKEDSARIADSVKGAAEKAKADSARIADSLAAAKKGGKAPVKPVKPKEVKAGQGKG
ncbi:MAG: hypothetical protein V2A54_10570 [Bacteroidota bacterium]